MMNEAVNPEVFSLASQLYVRMRRCSGRVVDAIYMAQNADYATEILSIAAKEQDQEILELVKRFEALRSVKEPIIQTKNTQPELPILTDNVKETESTEKMDIFSMTLRPFRRKAETVPTPVVEQTAATAVGHIEEIEEEVAHHYTGALR